MHCSRAVTHGTVDTGGARYEVVCHGCLSRVAKLQNTADTAVAHCGVAAELRRVYTVLLGFGWHRDPGSLI